MVMYKSDKSLWESSNGGSSGYSYTGSYYSSYSTETPESYAVKKIGEILDGIEEVKAELRSQGLSDLFPSRGTSSLSASKGKSGLEKKYQHANELVILAGRVHKEVLQNIDGKITQAMNDAVKKLDNVNEGKNAYKTDKLTFSETYTTTDPYSGMTSTYTTQKKYTLDQILNSSDSPIKATKLLYDERLKLINELMDSGEITDKETIKELKGMSNDELVRAFFPTQLGEFEELKSTWHENNAGWLKWVDIGLTVVVGVALVASAFVTGGASLLLAAPALAYLGTKAVVGIAGGTNMITGDILDTEDKVWLGVDFVASTLSFGAGAIVTKLGNSLREGSSLASTLKIAKGAGEKIAYAADKIELTMTTIRNPLLGVTLIGGEKGIGMIASKVISKFNVRRVAATIDESSLGRGWHDYFSTGDYSDLHGVQRRRLENLSTQLGGEFSAEDLAIINKYYDFQLPHDVGDNAFTGIGVREWNPGNLIDSGDQRIISEFELKIDEYNLAHSTIVDRFSEKQTEAIAQTAGDVSKALIDEGIPENLWDTIYDKIGIPKDLRNPAVN
ncbi:hypothetical protein HCA69_09690 [Listeria grandensis]|uniref:Uncharacterized protein n=1 Tax=Listeria grandensis TaxID=1494963 RepID=A0A7X1CQ37_9LIST|nr:hypothetical protein [Listeria grandensis]MBC1936638.1 hypothetical protein [Listeria grandensis]